MGSVWFPGQLRPPIKTHRAPRNFFFFLPQLLFLFFTQPLGPKKLDAALVPGQMKSESHTHSFAMTFSLFALTW